MFDIKKIIIPALLIAILFTFLIMLGFWQLDRAKEKQAITDSISLANSIPAKYIKIKNITSKEHRNILLDGKYLENKQLVYDNQIVNGMAGYFVLTPFLIKNSASIILVNRGFMPWNGKRVVKNITIKNTKTTIEGKIQIPKNRIKLKNTLASKTFPAIIQSIDFKNIKTILNSDVVIHSIILLSKNQHNGYIRQWQPFYSSVAKHIGYAVQWFLMALVLLIIAIILLFKKIKNL